MRTLIAILSAGVVIAAPVSSQGTRSALDDAAIAGIFDAANALDIETGSLATERGTRKDVKDFGAMLARDHRVVQSQGRDLAARLGVKPTPVPADFPLKVAHDAAMKKLKGLNGAAFDRAFLEHEVAFHQAVIDAVTSTLLPAISNAELKAFVQKVAPAFAGHKLAAETLLKPSR